MPTRATDPLLKPFDDFLQRFTFIMSHYASNNENDDFREQRQQMVERQLRPRGIADARILAAFLQVPRHEFVPPELQQQAYEDRPHPIGHGQTISQPFVVALMLGLAQVEPGDRVLDVGGGSGYQAALLAELGYQVVSVEIVEELAQAQQQRLQELGYQQVEVIAGDCLRVIDRERTFKAIIAAAAPREVPQRLIENLTPGGRLVMPVGSHDQELVVIEKRTDGTLNEMPQGRVSFVPMTGENERK
jgi:protein-L-isoaspartate(D-aspartate) O-methyltransferase